MFLSLRIKSLFIDLSKWNNFEIGSNCMLKMNFFFKFLIKKKTLIIILKLLLLYTQSGNQLFG